MSLKINRANVYSCGIMLQRATANLEIIKIKDFESIPDEIYIRNDFEIFSTLYV